LCDMAPCEPRESLRPPCVVNLPGDASITVPGVLNKTGKPDNDLGVTAMSTRVPSVERPKPGVALFGLQKPPWYVSTLLLRVVSIGELATLFGPESIRGICADPLVLGLVLEHQLSRSRPQ